MLPTCTCNYVNQCTVILDRGPTHWLNVTPEAFTASTLCRKILRELRCWQSRAVDVYDITRIVQINRSCDNDDRPLLLHREVSQLLHQRVRLRAL